MAGIAFHEPLTGHAKFDKLVARFADEPDPDKAEGIRRRIWDFQCGNIEQLFAEATLHPNASKITGVVCGIRVEEVEVELTRKARYMDKLVDELARGKKLESILRT